MLDSPRLRIAAAGLLAVWPCACDRPAGAPEAPSEASSSTPSRTLVLADGSTIAVPRHPRRVLPANSSLVDLLVELLPRERFAAIPRPAFAWSSLAGREGEWADVPVLEEFEAELVLTAEPDLVLVSPWSSRGAIELARRAGIAVLEVPDARTWDELVAGIELVGRALAVEERAAELVASLEQRRRVLTDVRGRRQRVLPYANFGTGGTTAGRDTTLDLVLELAGMDNAAADFGLVGHETIDLEQVLVIDPDVFLTSTGRDGVAPGDVFLRNEDLLADLRAVREDRILVLRAELFAAASIRVLDAAEELARMAQRFGSPPR